MRKVSATLLIIGKKQASVALAVQVLSKQDYTVIHMECIAQALTALQSNRPDLIILDYCTSARKGLIELQQQKHIASMPVMLILDLQKTSGLENELLYGAEGFISLPLDTEELLLRVKILLHLARSQHGQAGCETRQWAILNHAHVAVAYSDKNFNLTMVNAQFYQIFGNYKLHETTLFDLFKVQPTAQQMIQQQILEQTHNGGIYETEQQLYTVDGTLVWCQIRGKHLHRSETDASMVWSIDDISEKKQLVDKLRLAATVYQVTGEAIMIMDAQHLVINVNPAFSEMTGFSIEDIKDKPATRVIGKGGSYEDYPQIMTKLQIAGQWKGEQLIKRKNSDTFIALLLIDTVYRTDGSISHYVGVFSDFTERKQLEEELRYRAENDPLTRLPNRTLFFHRLQLALAGAKRYQYSVALLYIDLDGFKQINDNFGHGRGDAFLIEVANRLRKEIREMDTVARIGGDEFIVILNGTSNFLIETTAQRILDTLDLPVEENQQLFNVTASIGIALYPEHCQDANKLLQYADQAMYRAKHSGKRTFCWHIN